MPNGDNPLGSEYERARHPKAEPRSLPLQWFDDIEPVLSSADFVQGVLVEGSAAVLYGESNSGKTFLVTDLALHVVSGLSWHGRRVEQGGVVYCAMEGGNGFRNRVAAWREAHGGRELPFAAIPASLNLLDPNADTPALIEAIKAAERRMGQPVKLVVLDTLSRAMAGGNENSSEDMGALVGNVDRIRTETGACVVFVHHSGKDAARGARGHSLLRAAIDTELEVRADEATGMRTATVVKQRDLAKGSSFGFRLDVVTLGQNQHGEDVTTCLVRADEGSDRTHPAARLTSEERGWMADLASFFDDPARVHEGVVPVPGSASVRGATRDEIRGWLVQRGRLGVAGDVAPGGALSATDRSTLSRYLNRLKDKGKIGIFRDWIWLL